MATDQHFHNLYNRFFDKTATASERQELLSLLRSSTYDEELKAAIDRTWRQVPKVAQADGDAKAILAAIYQSGAIKSPIIHRVHFFRRSFFRFAAAIIILSGIGAYLWITNSRKQTSSAEALATADILPGGDKAILMLADGSTILLDSTGNGLIAHQGSTGIRKIGGQIVYDTNSSPLTTDRSLVYNTMTTPKGGQYQLILPDGSKVWLNAASSIQFPPTFVGNERKVKITGEAYFEVTKNKEKPFVVDVDGKVNIQVLGTRFNVNDYEDEGAIKTTLLEGSVKVSKGDKQTILKPGYQAVVAVAGKPGESAPPGSNPQFEIVNANIEQTLAWKNGIFNFNGLDTRQVMAQLARWYNIDVRYEGPVSADIFTGEMYRSEKLSFVLDMLRDMGIKCKIDGKTVIVTQ